LESRVCAFAPRVSQHSHALAGLGHFFLTAFLSRRKTISSKQKNSCRSNADQQNQKQQNLFHDSQIRKMAATVLILTGERQTSSLTECKNAQKTERTISDAFSRDVTVALLNQGKQWLCFGDDSWRMTTGIQNVPAALLLFALSGVNDIFLGTFVFKFTGEIMRAKARNWFAIYQDEAAFEMVCEEDSDEAFRDMFHKPVSKPLEQVHQSPKNGSRKNRPRKNRPRKNGSQKKKGGKTLASGLRVVRNPKRKTSGVITLASGKKFRK
jgi:hypothetical protein